MVEGLGRVLVLRLIAAAYVPASKAFPEMHPRAPGPEAIFAALCGGDDALPYLIGMCAPLSVEHLDEPPHRRTPHAGAVSGWHVLSALAVRPLPSIMTADATALTRARPAAMNIASLKPARNDSRKAARHETFSTRNPAEGHCGSALLLHRTGDYLYSTHRRSSPWPAGRSLAQNEEPSVVKNSASSGVVPRPRIPFLCGNRPNRSTISLCLSA